MAKLTKQTRQQQARAERKAAERRNRQRRKLLATALAIVLALVFLGTLLNLLSDDDDGSESATDTTTTVPGVPTLTPVPEGRTITGTTPCPAAGGESERASKFAGAPPRCIDPARTYTATFDTTEGRFVIALDTARRPETVNNFVVLSRYKYYDGSAIFRSDPSIDILQGGGPNTQSASDPGPGYNIADEGDGFTYTEGDIVMARSQGPDSASAQFFLASGPKVSLLDQQGTYVPFGKVTEGLDIVKSIAGLHVADPSSGLGGGPGRPVIVNRMVITES